MVYFYFCCVFQNELLCRPKWMAVSIREHSRARLGVRHRSGFLPLVIARGGYESLAIYGRALYHSSARVGCEGALQGPGGWA